MRASRSRFSRGVVRTDPLRAGFVSIGFYEGEGGFVMGWDGERGVGDRSERREGGETYRRCHLL